MRLIWATRGRNWGFRFLRDGEFTDPLPAYEEAFEGAEGRGEEYRRSGDRVALRFPDPDGRRDGAGRIIPHDFVVFGPEADGFDSVESGRDVIWPLVRDEYGRIWDQPKPTAAE